MGFFLFVVGCVLLMLGLGEAVVLLRLWRVLGLLLLRWNIFYLGDGVRILLLLRCAALWL